MGCDIHAYIERKFGDIWISISYEQLDLARDYTLFHIMANVRSGKHALIRQPKGLPDEISFTALSKLFYRIRGDASDSDGHSLTESDVKKYCSLDAIRRNISGVDYIIDENYHSITYFDELEILQINKEFKQMMSMDSADCMFIYDILISITKRYNSECGLLCWFDN